MRGKVAIVTGGATGIGRAIVMRCVELGANVLFNYSRSEVDAKQTLADVAIPAAAQAFRADVRDAVAVNAMVKQATETYGRLDLLVNNAAVSPPVPPDSGLDALSDELWNTVIDVNVRGAFNCARAAAPHLRAVRGAIVNIGSIAGLTGEGSSLPYAVSKSALHGLSKTLARALAPEVRVSCVVPGFVKTRWWAGREDVADRLRRRLLLDRTTTPEDVAHLVCNVAMQQGLTGHFIVLDGGQTA
jgi:3-oxoacyl-[acyl-carrier protein] reductase